MKDKLPLYSRVISLSIVFLVIIGIYSSADFSFYMLLVPVILIAGTYLLSTYSNKILTIRAIRKKYGLSLVNAKKIMDLAKKVSIQE